MITSSPTSVDIQSSTSACVCVSLPETQIIASHPEDFFHLAISAPKKCFILLFLSLFQRILSFSWTGANYRFWVSIFKKQNNFFTLLLITLSEDQCRKYKPFAHRMSNYTFFSTTSMQVENHTLLPLHSRKLETNTIFRIMKDTKDIYLPIPSGWAGCDIRSILKRNLTGLNREFSFF